MALDNSILVDLSEHGIAYKKVSGKATAAAIKGIVAAIAAGGWVAVLIIVLIALIGLVVGSVYAIFVPSESGGITIYGVMSDLEREYHEKQSELAASCQCDVLNYYGDIATWEAMPNHAAVKAEGRPTRHICQIRHCDRYKIPQMAWCKYRPMRANCTAK